MSGASSHQNNTVVDTTTTSSSSSNTAVLQTEETLRNIMTSVFPPTHYDDYRNIVYAFGYGSGVFSQQQQQQQQQQPLRTPSSQNENTIRVTSSANNNNNNNNNKMIDFILVVNDVQEFHRMNLKYNPQHYNFSDSLWLYHNQSESSIIQQQRAELIAWVQCHTIPSSSLLQSYFSNPGVYFHIVDDIQQHQMVQNNDRAVTTNTTTTTIPPPPSMMMTGGIKYGIISQQSLRHDLQHWTHLYMAGRMHKPIVPIVVVPHHDDDETTPRNCISSIQQQSNLPAALATAILYQWYYDQQQQEQQSSITSVPSPSPLQDIYKHIVQISYSGDPRMGMFEDTQKVHNIITAQYHHFHQLYLPILQPFIREGFLELSSTSSSTTSNTPSSGLDTPTPQTSTKTAIFPPSPTLPQQQPPLQQQHHTISYNWDHPSAHDRLWQCLPFRIRQQCRTMTAPQPYTTSFERHRHNDPTQQQEMNSIRQLQTMISQSIVAPAARYQSIKGLYSTGLRKSIIYLYRKFTKGRFGNVLLSSATRTSTNTAATTTATTTVAATTAVLPKKN